MMEIDEKGGYDVEFVGNEPHNVTCCICLLVLREPMQAEQCGHRFCNSCVEDLKNASRNGKIVCPEDRLAINVFKDKGKEREILNSIVKCSNNKDGCTVTKELREIQEHIRVCEFQLIQCPVTDCQEKLKRKCLKDHKKEKHNLDRMDSLEKKLDQALQKINSQAVELQSQAVKLNKQSDEINGLRASVKLLNNGATDQIFCSSYTWKSYQYNRNVQMALNDRNYQPLVRRFFTSKGYRMNAELYIQGDGEDYGDMMTIRFSVAAGAFDDTLKWPMAAIIQASLIFDGTVISQQKFDTKRISKTLRYIYQRPPIPKLPNSYKLRLMDADELDNFVANDSVSIKIDISHY